MGLLLAGGAMARAAEPGRAARERAVDALFAELERPGSPGAAIGIYQGGRPVYAHAYGYADLEHRVPMTVHSVFNAASVSKQFTAFAIALLAREGKVDLDADIRRYLPYVPDFGHPITVSQLIHHTSGLRTSEMLFELGGQDLRGTIRQQHVVNMVMRQRALNFEPGTEFLYCNTGYSLLAEIVAAASGRSFRAFTTERIFRPLGMAHSFFHDDLTEVLPHRAQSYERSGDDARWIRSVESYDVIGATGLMTNVEDMLAWAGNFARPVVGDLALIGQLAAPGQLNDGTAVNYGFGLRRRSIAGHEAWAHAGSSAGYTTHFAYFPQRDFAIVVLMNAPFEVDGRVAAIADLYLNGGRGESVAPRATIAPDPALPSAAAGYYMSEFGRMIELVRDGSTLLWNEPGNEPTPMVFRDDGTFDLGSGEDESYRFLPRTDGEVHGFTRMTGEGAVGARLLFRRVQPATPSAAGLAELAGRYFSPELDVTYDISVEQGRLVARSIWLVEPIEFTPGIVDRFDSPHWAMSTIVVVRDARGRVAGLRIQADRIRNVQLDRLPAP
ncbi:MAG: serine hydrolase domain-containing protein [Steroidobacteraceae bacterium]